MSARAQQGELPAGSSLPAPGPIPTPPLGAGAGTGTANNGAKPSPADQSAPLPAAAGAGGSGTSPGTGDAGNSMLFGVGTDGGKIAVPGTTRRLPYSLTIGVSASYDNNPFLSGGRGGNGDGGGDFSFGLSANFVFGLDNLVSATGNYLHFTYTPVATFYVSDSENDSVQHLVGLDVQYHLGRFAVSMRESVQILDGTDSAGVNPAPGGVLLPGQTSASTPVYSTGTINQVNLDVGARSQRDIYDTSLNVGFGYSDKLSLNAGIDYSVNNYSRLISSEDLSGSLSADYVYDLKTVVGIGVSGGRSFVESPSPSQTSFQTNLRGNYVYSKSLSFAGSVGLEYLLSDEQSGLQITPVFDLSASYHPSDLTSVTLAASRSVQNSAVLVAQDFESTDVSMSIQRTINSRLSGSLALGYENSQYVSEADRISASRNENYFTVQPSIGIQLRPGLSVSIFYVHRQSSSSGNGRRSFNDDQVGVSTGFAF